MPRLRRACCGDSPISGWRTQSGAYMKARKRRGPLRFWRKNRHCPALLFSSDSAQPWASRRWTTCCRGGWHWQGIFLTEERQLQKWRRSSDTVHQALLRLPSPATPACRPVNIPNRGKIQKQRMPSRYQHHEFFTHVMLSEPVSAVRCFRKPAI